MLYFYNIYRQISPLQSADIQMKIIQIIKQATIKITNKILQFIVPHRKILKSKPTPTHSQISKFKSMKPRRRKTFNSFLRQNPDLMHSFSSRKGRKIRKAQPLSKNSQQLQEPSPNSLSCSCSSFINNKEVVTNVIVAADGEQIESEPLFIDKNGLEISVIQQKENKVEQLNYSGDSDSEILKFVFGDEESIEKIVSKPTKAQQDPFPQKKQWWKQIIQKQDKLAQNTLNQRFSLIQECDSDQFASHNDSSSKISKKKMKTKRIKHHFHNKNMKYSHIKVITIIDLIYNQERPQTFEVPLSKTIVE